MYSRHPEIAKTKFTNNRALNLWFLDILEDKLCGQVLGKPDVYVVSGSEVVEWLRSPLPSSRLSELRGWGCQAEQRKAFTPCRVSNRCGYDTELDGGEHWSLLLILS